MSEQTARPCPFCGSTMLAACTMTAWWYQCDNCGASGPSARTEAEALAEWNKRAPDADNDRLRELERAVGVIRAEYKSEVWQALEQVYALRQEEQALHDERTHLMAAYLQAWREGYRKGKADHLSDLEMAVRDAMHPLPMGRGWVWRGDATDIAAIGRLLEGERDETQS